MAAETHDFDLAGLRLAAGEGRRLTLDVRIEPLLLGGERYAAAPERVPVELEVSRMLGGGYALPAALPGRARGAVYALSEAGWTARAGAEPRG